MAQNDEMANCNKQVQLLAFGKLSEAASKEFIEVPCNIGGHAGLMDSRGLIGHQQTWRSLMDTMERFLLATFDDLRPPSMCVQASAIFSGVAREIQACFVH